MGRYFRADKRVFKPGDKIRTAGHFIDMHPESGKRTEGLLEAARPEGKPHRGSCLMLFESEQEARTHCAKMSGGQLYVIEADDTEASHRGDMALVNKIDRLIIAGAEEDARRLAEQYWSGAVTATPCVEVLLDSAVVVADLGYTQAEREAFFRSLLQGTGKPPSPRRRVMRMIGHHS